MSDYRTTPAHSEKMPAGIPYIISNEAAERFSFYGMKGILFVFLVNYLSVLGGKDYTPAEATATTSFFTAAVYLTPILGAIIADTFFGKYRTIISLSIVYCLGHLCLALMGVSGPPKFWLLAGLGLVSLGAGGIKPCVSAHVGDQFGTSNQHLITRIFNIFYFSINLGAVVSNLAIPIILEHYGPHWAFGVPGILMALATLFFWMGRNKFVHVPAHGRQFIAEIFSREGRAAIGKLIPLYLFVAVFWCLFDQTANTLVFQAERMDRNLFGIQVLPSQIQAANPFLILVLIPLFTFVIYPFAEKRLKLTPLRKVGTGLFLMVISFAVISLAQESIDRGGEPHVAWQLLAYLIFTSAEILISIVCLEFSYTQAPKKMKSFIMGLFLASVFAGNMVTGLINLYIQVPKTEFSSGVNPGLDGKIGTMDDLKKTEDGTIESPVSGALAATAERVTSSFEQSGTLPAELADLPDDPWGNPLRYQFVHKQMARIVSDGPDQQAKTPWDLGLTIEVSSNEDVDRSTWLYREKEKLGLLEPETDSPDDAQPLEFSYTAGGGLRLERAAYFWFFTKLMLVTAILFIPFAMVYKPRTYLQDESEAADEIHPPKP
ncbi:MAG: POT family MFS transporter [Verrucomicrobiales bacterium]